MDATTKEALDLIRDILGEDAKCIPTDCGGEMNEECPPCRHYHICLRNERKAAKYKQLAELLSW